MAVPWLNVYYDLEDPAKGKCLIKVLTNSMLIPSDSKCPNTNYWAIMADMSLESGAPVLPIKYGIHIDDYGFMKVQLMLASPWKECEFTVTAKEDQCQVTKSNSKGDKNYYDTIHASSTKFPVTFGSWMSFYVRVFGHIGTDADYVVDKNVVPYPYITYNFVFYLLLERERKEHRKWYHFITLKINAKERLQFCEKILMSLEPKNNFPHCEKSVLLKNFWQGSFDSDFLLYKDAALFEDIKRVKVQSVVTDNWKSEEHGDHFKLILEGKEVNYKSKEGYVKHLNSGFSDVLEDIDFDIIECKWDSVTIEINSRTPIGYRKLEIKGETVIEVDNPLYNQTKSIKLNFSGGNYDAGDEVILTMANIWGRSKTVKGKYEGK